jgi:hypothetical protein
MRVQTAKDFSEEMDAKDAKRTNEPIPSSAANSNANKFCSDLMDAKKTEAVIITYDKLRYKKIRTALQGIIWRSVIFHEAENEESYPLNSAEMAINSTNRHGIKGYDKRTLNACLGMNAIFKVKT